jgi:hypothetical protein
VMLRDSLPQLERLASLRLGLKQLMAEMRILHLTDEVDFVRGTMGTEADPENRTVD